MDYNIITIIVTTLLSITISIITSLLTVATKKKEINSSYSLKLLEKRIECYPKLHKLTDTLGMLIRDKATTVDIGKMLHDFEEWDANYSVFTGSNVTQYMGIVRRILEKYTSNEKYSNDSELMSLLYGTLVRLEYNMKTEIGVFATEDFRGNVDAKLTDEQYLRKVEVKLTL